MTDSTMSPPPASEVPYERPQWPKVVGIISICIGGFLSCCGACGLIGILNQGNQKMPEGMTPPPTPPMIANVLQVVGFGMSLVLLAAGILLTTRKPFGRILHVIYAVIGLPLGFVSMFVQMNVMASMQQWAHDNPSIGKFADLMTAGFVVGIALGLALLAYNVFLIVYLGIIKRKADLGSTALEELP